MISRSGKKARRMDVAVLSKSMVKALSMSAWLVSACLFWGQALPPVPPKPSGPANRLAEVRRKVESTKAADVTAQRALGYSRAFLGSAEAAVRSKQPFQADRMADAADALLHVAEHQQHLRTGGGPKGPPDARELHDHLQRVYFRTQQSSYFLSQAHDSRAASFPKWASDFYQLAMRAYERKDLVAADENAKSAEEIVRALESLAQAASPAPIPPTPPKPPPVSKELP
jgi:hypothetical protein